MGLPCFVIEIGRATWFRRPQANYCPELISLCFPLLGGRRIFVTAIAGADGHRGAHEGERKLPPLGHDFISEAIVFHAWRHAVVRQGAQVGRHELIESVGESAMVPPIQLQGLSDALAFDFVQSFGDGFIVEHKSLATHHEENGRQHQRNQDDAEDAPCGATRSCWIVLRERTCRLTGHNRITRGANRPQNLTSIPASKCPDVGF